MAHRCLLLRFLFASFVAAAALLPSAAGGTPLTKGATLVPVKIFAPRGDPGPRCDRVYALRRQVHRPAVLTATMRALLAGPTAKECRAGYGRLVLVSHERDAAERQSRPGCRASIDFRDFSRVIPNASSSCGSSSLLAQLDRTASQFPTVRRAVYSFNGSRRAFYEWLQRSPPPLP